MKSSPLTHKSSDNWENQYDPKQLLDEAISLYSPKSTPVSSLERTKQRTFTKRGVVWLGQTCNLRCHFCYFLDRIGDKCHPEHKFMPIEKARKICKTLVDVYGNTAIDIQGGEPTIYKPIFELVRYCDAIGLYPTLITNGLVLANRDKCLELKGAGVRDYLMSVQGLGAAHDKVVGVEGAFKKLMTALNNMADIGSPYRFNCVMSKIAAPLLPSIAKLAVHTGANAVNFIAFNPFEDQKQDGIRTGSNVPQYSDVAGPLIEALDILAQGNIEANVRYFPFCMLPERHRRSNYNFKQLPYDHHEWDFASWTWTQETAQRISEGDTSIPPRMGRRLDLGPLKEPARKLASHQILGPLLRDGYNMLSQYLQGEENKVDRYNENAELRAVEHCGYKYNDACQHCSLKSICDGFHGDYVDLFGTAEAKTVRLEKNISDPTHYIQQQEKLVEKADESWAITK